MRITKHLCIALAVLFCIAAFAAETPQKIPFWGYLTARDGAPISGAQNIKFELYDAEKGGSLIWSEVQNGVVLDEGQLSVTLGDIQSFDDKTLVSSDLWLSVTVNPGTEDEEILAPRTRLLPVSEKFDLGRGNGRDPHNALDDTTLVGILTVTDKIQAGPGTLANGAFAFATGANDIADGDFSVVAGGSDNLVRAEHSAIGGGGGNEIRGDHSVISGGFRNLTDNSYNTVGGGSENEATGIRSGVFNGHHNRALNEYSAILGGKENTASSSSSVVGGGSYNEASGDHGGIFSGDNNRATGVASAILGGNNNIASNYSCVGGGTSNEATGDHSGILNGEKNQATGFLASILGGQGNLVSDGYCVVGGGFGNQATSGYGVVVGGYQNTATAFRTFVGGGAENHATFEYSTVGGGLSNYATAGGSAVVGGGYNKASGNNAFIGAGGANKARGNNSLIVGGGNNAASGTYSAIVGGGGDLPADSNCGGGQYTFIGGGQKNYSMSEFASIVGGRYNRTYGAYSVINGGGGSTPADSNCIKTPNSVIGGGSRNLCDIGGAQQPGLSAVIGGGRLNKTYCSGGTIGGGANNMVYGQEVNTIGGGGGNTIGALNSWDFGITIGGGESNVASGSYATVAGGLQDTVSAYAAFVGGGLGNRAAGDKTLVCGGENNKVTSASSAGAIVGGSGNVVTGGNGFIGGGQDNLVSLGWGAICGGRDNRSSSNCAFVGAGRNNHAWGIYSVVSGGGGATVADSNSAYGSYSMIPGGQKNSTASGADYAFAAGRRAQANHTGAFVWGDATDSNIASSANNQVTFRASGGFRIATTTTGTVGVKLDNGDTAWEVLSDSTKKANRHVVNTTDILNKVDSLPIEEWNYTHQDESNTHIGPMAQNFHRIFGYGDDDKSISTIDPDGIALAAIQELSKRVRDLEAENSSMKADIASLKEVVETLAARDNNIQKASFSPTVTPSETGHSNTGGF